MRKQSYRHYKIIIFILGLIPLMATAQRREFRHLTIKDGLSHDNIYTIIQDKEGFMWLGSQNGLDKYNGYSFISYFHNASDSCSLVSANFGKVFQDSKGRIWFGTYRGGLSCYFPTQNKIIHYSHNKNEPKSLLSNLVRTVAEDRQGRIWVTTTRGGLHLFNEKEQNFTSFVNDSTNENSLVSNNANSLSNDASGYLWVGTDKGLSRVNTKTFEIKNFKHQPNNPLSLGSSKIQSLFIDSKNTLWVGTRDKGIYKYSSLDTRFTPFSEISQKAKALDQCRIQCIFESSNGIIWIGTYNSGLFAYNPKTNNLISYKNHPEDPNSLSHNKIETIFEDNAHNLWIGTRGGGVNILDLKPEKFKNIQYSATQSNSIAGKSISKFAISENNNKIWIATNTGLSLYDKNTGVFKNFYTNPNDENSLSSNRIRTLLQTKEGTLWVGTYDQGITQIYKNNSGDMVYNRFLNKKENILTGNQINALMLDHEDKLWIGTNFGVTCISLQNNIPNIKKFDNENCKLKGIYIITLFMDSKNTIWLGTSAGLYKYLPDSDNFKLYFNKQGTENSIDINNITQIFEDKTHNLWIGTGGGGIFLFDSETGTFAPNLDKSYRTGNISGILEAKPGILWLSTGKGISRFNTQTKEFKYFGTSDGLSETGFNTNACLKLPSGELLFGSISGFTIFDPENIYINKSKPNVVLTDFKIFNNTYFKNQNSFCAQTPSSLKQIDLTFNDYVFSFEFSALDFTTPSKNKYRYMLEGFDKNWIDFGTKHYAMFTNLSPGTYTFKAQGTNNDGVWSSNEQTLSIKVIVHPAFWQTTQFYIGISVLLLIFIALFIKYRLSKLRKEKVVLEQKVLLRTKVVEQQKEVLRENSEKMKIQNENIKSSIRYAKTIQEAILPFKTKFDSFSENLIIYKPKDIVSGDFYWYEQIANYIFIATVDCSGHGVPGAFMSMIGSSLLKEIVAEKNIFEPNEILEKLDAYVKRALKQDQTDNRDGMDVCLLRLEKTQKGYKSVFCGAKRDLLVLKKGQTKIERTRGTHRSIGGVFLRKQEQTFTNIEHQFEAGDTIYLATDGFIDQNNSQRVRFGTSRLISVLESNATNSLEETKRNLLEALEKFKGDSLQRDDITLIGLRLK